MKWLYAGLAFLAALLVAAAAALGWLVGTESGLHWAAAQVPGLRFEGLRGRLTGEIAADKLAYQSEGLLVEAEKLSLRAHLAALLGGRLTIQPLAAASLRITLSESGGEAKPPKLPLRIDLSHVRVDDIEVRRGTARYVLRQVELDHAIIGPDLSISGSFYWPDERFATRGKLHLRGSFEKIDAQLIADVSGVAAEARAQLAPYAPEKLRSIEVRAGPIDVARFVAAAPHTALDVVLKASGGPGGTLAGTLSAANGAAGSLDADRLPVTRLETSFITDLTSLRLQRARATLHGGGNVSGEGALQAGRVDARLVAAGVDLRSIHSRLRQTGLSGPLQVLIEGERLAARGQLTQEGIGLEAEVVRTGQTVEVRTLRALVEGGEVAGTGRMTLGNSTSFSARLDVKRFNPAAIGDYPAGSLSGQVSAAGRLEPRQIDLKWNLSDSTLYERAFQSQGTARIVGQRVTQADGEVRLGANRLTARGAYGRPGDELAFTLDAPQLEELAPLAGRLRAQGTLSGSLDNPRASISAEAEQLSFGRLEIDKASAKLAGSLAAHELTLSASASDLALDVVARLRGGWNESRGWAGEVLSLKNAGDYPVELVAPAALKLAPGRVEVGRLEARVAGGRVLVRDLAWSSARLASSGEFAGLPAQWLVVGFALGERMRSTLLLNGEWQLAQAQQLEGFVRLRRASGDIALGGENPIDLELERAELELRFGGGATTGSADIASRAAHVSLQGQLAPALSVQGKIDFAELRTLAGPFIEGGRVDGRLFGELRASGTLKAPEIHGTLFGERLALELPLYGIALKDGALKATLEGDSLRLESFSLRGGEGRFTASGTLPLGLDGTARVTWRAEKLAALQRPDRRLVVSGQGEASYDGKRVALSGELRADSGHFEFERTLPTLGDDVVVAGREPPRPKGKVTLPLALELRVDLGDNLVVRGFGFDGKLTGLIDLATNKDGELRAFGRVRSVNATFLAYGQRLDVDPGVLIFDGPIDNPSLQITAWRRKQAVEAGVQLSGTLRAPAVQLVSQPPVSEGERLSWLVLGRAPSGMTQADLGLLQAAAGALLAGDESVPLDRRLARRIGLDEVSLRGTGELNDRVVAVGKRLSDRVYISYEQGLGVVASNLIKLDYALGRRWTLRAETGTSSGGGIFYRYSWD